MLADLTNSTDTAITTVNWLRIRFSLLLKTNNNSQDQPGSAAECILFIQVTFTCIFLCHTFCGRP